MSARTVTNSPAPDPARASPPAAPPLALLVAGDVSTEYHLTPGIDGRTVARERAPGGAVLLDRLIAACEGRAPAPDRPGPEGTVGYHLWRRVQSRTGGNNESEYERFLGFDPPTVRPVDRLVSAEAMWPGVLVLDDIGLGFRKTTPQWPQVLTADPPPGQRGTVRWVFLKTAHPLVENNELLDRLLETFPDRLVVVFTVDDLRQMDIQIGRDLSWERTIGELVARLQAGRDSKGQGDSRLRLLRRCPRLVVMLGRSGAVLLDNVNSPQHTAIFDPTAQLGADSRESDLSRYYTAWLTASLVADARADPNMDLVKAIRGGLALLSAIFPPDATLSDVASGVRRLMGLPPRTRDQGIDRAAVLRRGSRFTERWRIFPCPPDLSGWWTFLPCDPVSELQLLAEKVVLHGLTELKSSSYPYAQFGDDLITADRREIERFRTIYRLLEDHSHNVHAKRPLCMGVFGSPGTGKSFVVKALAGSVYKKAGQKVEFLTFNLSQFSKPTDLHGAFHQVRDSVLRGASTVVFWDEFDSPLDGESLGWLQYFLAPMQDGQFQEGQITHPLGKSVFVFAGGVYPQWEDFDSRADAPAHVASDNPTGLVDLARAALARVAPAPERGGVPVMDAAAWKKAKGPDFRSRLQGHLDILGPNRSAPAPADRGHWLRRAILLRAHLKSREPMLFQGNQLAIDLGVLNALLYTTGYQYGARSMEAVIAMSVLTGRTRFERSCLPPDDQLRMHLTNLGDFQAILDGRSCGDASEPVGA